MKIPLTLQRILHPQRVFFWTVAIAAGLLQTWPQRFVIKPDGLNYLDVASAYMRHDWSTAINSYWSPLYSWLLATVFLLFHPSPYWESTVLHVLNFVIFLGVFRSGEFFITELIAGRPEDRIPAWAVWWIGYSLLLFVSLFMIAVFHDTPDMLVSGLVYIAAALLLRIRSGRARQRTFVIFGVLLALMYFAKTVMFLIAFAFLVAAGLRRGTAVALACFAAVSLLWIMVLSHATGHLTYGDAGPANYVIYVASSGTPLHPPRVIFTSPTVREFATPFRSTYPPWYNAAYWLDGVHPRFDARAQFQVLAGRAKDYLHILSGQKEFLVAFLVLFFASSRKMLTRWWVMAPALLGLGLYSLVHVEPRLVAPFFVLLWLPLFAGLSARSQRIILIACLIIVASSLFKIGRLFITTPRNATHVEWQAAEALHQMGISPDSKVAYFGQSEDLAHYWARLAGFRIVADMQKRDMAQFWSAPPEVRADLFARLAALSVRAVITSDCPPNSGSDWKPVPGTSYCVNILNGATSASE